MSESIADLKAQLAAAEAAAKEAEAATAELAQAVKDADGPALDRRKIEVVPPIKSTGRHSASVRLHPDVVAPLEVNVVAAR